MEIGFDSIEGIYNSMKFSLVGASVSIFLIFIVFIISVFKIAYANLEESSKGYSFSSFTKIVKPLIPFLIGSTLLVSGSSLLEAVLGEIIGSFDIVNEFSSAGEELTDMIQDKKTERMEYLKSIGILEKGFNPAVEFNMMKYDFETGALEFIREIDRYLFTFAIAVYFLWLVVIEAFSPMGVIGFVYQELRTQSETWIKNYMACKLFLVLLFVADTLSVGIYKLYRANGDYNLIIHLLLFLALRGYLYKSALSICRSII